MKTIYVPTKVSSDPMYCKDCPNIGERKKVCYLFRTFLNWDSDNGAIKTADCISSTGEVVKDTPKAACSAYTFHHPV